MNTQNPSFTRYLVGAALVFLGMIFLIVAAPVSFGRSDQDKCDPWQYRDENGDCVDRPHVHHHPDVHYEPAGSEQCWVECMCEEGSYPSGNDCGPCSFVGTVCMDL